MRYIDCFNGDADGICGLTQLRLQNPIDSELVTGVKRDINLLDRVDASAGDLVTVLDISLDKNRIGLERVLKAGAEVFYCDHHFAGEMPDHRNFTAVINTAPDVCTSLLINRSLKGRFLEWALVGTFGDNLERSAIELAKSKNFSSEQMEQLKNLGIYLNYNGYGASLDDLYFDPAQLFKRTSQYVSALDFIQGDGDTFMTLQSGYLDDMSKAASLDAEFDNPQVAVFQLPNAAWARRVSGVFGNQLANETPNRGHAVLTERSDGDFLVSVRAPLANKKGADEICRQFATGGGRKAAAGINQLPATDVDRFIAVFSDYYHGANS